MNDFLRMCFNIITQIGPYLVVLLLLKYLVNLQQKRAKEREEEQKKGIIRTHYTIKTEKFLVVAFIVGTIFFACCTAMSLREKEDMFVICIFGIFFLVGISGIVNMVMKSHGGQLLEKRELFVLGILPTAREKKVLCVYM